MLSRFLNILFPQSCPVCSEPCSWHITAPLCRNCWEAIEPYRGPACRRCGRPLVSDASLLCGDCVQDEPAFHSCRSFGLYDGPLKKAINLLKYYGIKRLSLPLSEMMLSVDVPRADVVVPVPLFRRRLRDREFNQSALLAKQAADNLSLSLTVDCLLKTKDTSPQVGLSSKERRRNIKNAFSVQKTTTIKGRKILLIDDVITTGSTVRECSKVLKEAGAGDIHVLALAHGMRD